MEQITLKLEQSPTGCLEIRTGTSLPLKEPRLISHTGIITTPADWADKRKETITPLMASVVANYTTRTIVLTIAETEHYNTTITGVLKLYPELEKLGINAQTMYGEKELYSRLNFYSRWFADKQAHKNLLDKLQKFKAKVTQAFMNTDDYKGNAAVEKLTTIEHEIPLQFELNIPLFTGGGSTSFKVDIGVTVRNGGVEFWFESVELHELISTLTDKIFDEQLQRLSEYVVVKQW